MPNDFSSLLLSPSLETVVAELGYTQPTPIQTASIPPLLAGEDVMGQSRTGSGKTAAFALPILQKLRLESRSLQALVICPTRELAAQVAREFRRFGRKHPGLGVLELVGGQAIKLQVPALSTGAHVVVGTPGRLLDHLRRGTLEVGELKTVVLDEADRMLDMGFGADVEAILSQLPSGRQTALFSATFPNAIEAMSQAHQKDPIRVNLEEAEKGTSTLRQLWIETERADKVEALYRVFHEYPHESVLIFCNFKATVSKLVRQLSNSGFSVDRLDGNLEQFFRDQVLARFRNGSLRVLIATDVAGRGIDVSNLELVVNYELPDQPEIYVHRIGRTGRAGKAGLAVSLVSARDRSKIEAVEGLIGEPVERIVHKKSPGPNLKRLAREPKMQTILISGGRKDKVRPGDILGALTGKAGGLRGDDIGAIEVQDRLSYVAVARVLARTAAESLNTGRIKGKRFRATLIS